MQHLINMFQCNVHNDTYVPIHANKFYAIEIYMCIATYIAS